MRKNELKETFANLVLFAKNEEADLMILSGDVFDGDFVTKETVSFLRDQFASVPDCRFVIAPGNHDPISERSPYRKVVFSENVYIFQEETVSCFSFPEIGVDVYGYAFTGTYYEKNPLAQPVTLDKNKINILAAHADVGGKSRYCPLSVSDIASSGFDYVALGHIHKGGELKTAGKTYYAYCGCPEGRSFDECGVKGAFFADMLKTGGKLSAKFVFKRFGKSRYEKMTLDVTGIPSQDALNARVRDKILEEGFGSDTLLRVRLTGRISPETKIDADRLDAKTLGVYFLETEDATLPLLDYENLKNDISIRGAFFRELLPLLESENEEERRTAAQALRYGLAALDGNDIVDF
jgi:DNA repair exonuclease SbcCD nuclease subunit